VQRARPVPVVFENSADRYAVGLPPDPHQRHFSGRPSFRTLRDPSAEHPVLGLQSLTLRSHWVLLVMDQYTRRTIGFAVQPGVVDGVAVLPDAQWDHKH